MPDDMSHFRPSSFLTQTDALLRKNLTYQKRNTKTNCRLICFPLSLCIIMAVLQVVLLLELNKGSSNKCGTDQSTLEPTGGCAIQNPPEWPALLQVPEPQNRAVRTEFIPSMDLPHESCRLSGSCPATVLITGSNQTLGQTLSANMFASSVTLNSSNVLRSLANIVLGSSTPTQSNYVESAFHEYSTLYNLKNQCTSKDNFSVSIQQSGINFRNGATCVRVLTLWRNSSFEVNEQLYKGYRKGNSEGKINEILAAYDFLNSDGSRFNVSVWYKANTNNLRVPRSVNVASNAYLHAFHGLGAKMLFEFVKELPKPATKQEVDVASFLGPLFVTWVVLLLFPVVTTSLVYEREQKLRIMMKMHGLGDGPYWIISYVYFLTVSVLYILVFVVFGSAIGLRFFALNDYTVQSVFYFIYLNLQISLAFLLAAIFSNVKTATVVAYICVFGTGLLGQFLFQPFLEDQSFPNLNPRPHGRPTPLTTPAIRWVVSISLWFTSLIYAATGIWIVVLELYPGFSLYSGLYEFALYSTQSNGMRWESLNDTDNGMKEVLIIMLVEWLLLLFVASCMNQVLPTGSSKGNFQKKQPSSSQKPSWERQGSKVLLPMDKPDVTLEMEKVEQLLLEPSTIHGIISDNLRKVYPGRDGNPEKVAVRGLSLALSRGECFGMLGPNGAGKTSFINMMIGLTSATSGTAYVEGLDLRTEMDRIYSSIGVCPQHDLLWETLTGREHLLFYGRLKNLKGSTLTKAVQESLRSVDLDNGEAADKQVGKYSGGMKRRLSVAISLIGDPKVVYMDEPSTGMDPASRRNLWNVVKRAKRDRTIILTTHSMEEAEFLCDRIGMFVDGSMLCIGNPKEVKARYGGSYVFTMTTSVDHEQEVVDMVQQLSPRAKRTYHTSGTQKFEIPKREVRIADVFYAVAEAKSRFPVFAWGVSDTTLEDVFIKVAAGA